MVFRQLLAQQQLSAGAITTGADDGKFSFTGDELLEKQSSLSEPSGLSVTKWRSLYCQVLADKGSVYYKRKVLESRRSPEQVSAAMEGMGQLISWTF